MNYITSNSKTVAANILFNLLAELGYSDIKSFQKANGLVVDGVFGLKSHAALYNKLLKVVPVNFESNYFKSNYSKKQIIWHHSAGWDNARGMFDWWKKDGRTHVATAIGIEDDGKVYKGFDEGYWAASIGCKAEVFKQYGIELKWAKNRHGKWYATNNMSLDMGAVAVEICNWGNLTQKTKYAYSWANTVVDEDKVIELDYKGYTHFEKYTDAEIKSLKYWTLLMAIRFDIPVEYDEDRFWTVNKDALSGKKGLYTHNSYRVDKTDVSPQPHLIEMAKTLGDYMK
jgi:hypothetical protein